MKIELSERQLEIIETSGKILMNKGLTGLTTKNLAQEMNFSESALYRHFKDKEAIVILLIRYLSQNINQRFEVIINSEINPKDKILELFKSQFTFFKANPHFIIIVLSDGLMDNSDTIKAEILKLMQANVSVIKNTIEQGQKLNVFTQIIDSESLVHFAMGTFRLQMLKWKLANFSFDIEKHGMQTINNLITLFTSKL